MNMVTRQLFAELHGLAADDERRLILRLWSMAKAARRAPDRDLECTADALLGMNAPHEELSRAAYVATLCVFAQERRTRRVLRHCAA